MEVDEADNSDKNSGSAPDSKAKGKRKFYVGSQDLGFRRDHMEVGFSILSSCNWSFVHKNIISEILIV